MNKLVRCAKEFISQFDSSEGEMRRIVREFMEIADEVRNMQEGTDTARTAGAVGGGVTIGLGILFAPFTGGASLALAVAGVTIGGATVVGSNVTQVCKEKGYGKKVQELGEVFMHKVEPMKGNLEEIKTTCEELEQESRKHQAEKTLKNMEEFNDILRRVSELRTRSKGVLEIIIAALTSVNGLLQLIVAVVRVTSTPEQDAKLRASIIESSDQCKKVTDELEKMKDKVEVFTEQ